MVLETVVDGLATTVAIRRRTYSSLRRAVACIARNYVNPQVQDRSRQAVWEPTLGVDAEAPTARRSSIFRLLQRRVFR